MPRHLRSVQSGWHHVTNRGIDRQPVFRTDADRLDFGRMLARGCDESGVRMLAYCLMDNHYHLVLACPDGGLSPFMQQLGARFTRHANERHGGDGPIFRSRFFSRSILSEQYLVNAVRYVHRNPLAIQPAVALDQYRWSSHRTYLGLRPTPPWLATSPVLDWFESPSRLHQLVTDDVDDDAVIGGGAAAVIAACEAAIDLEAPERDRAPQGRLRVVLYALLDRMDVATRHEVLQVLSPSSTAAARQAARRAERAVSADPMLRAVIRTAVELAAPGFRLCQTRPERGLVSTRSA